MSRAQSESPPPGRILKLNSRNDSCLSYYLYLPTSGTSGAPIFVSVHGISGNAKEHAESFRELAEKHGIVLIAPRFSLPRFKDYQRLGRGRRGVRADLALNAVVREVGEMTSANSDGIYLFGYSGGGQFVHRYAMAYPERVMAYVVGAAGWYTFPDGDVRYPRGLLGNGGLTGASFNLNDFLRVRAAVMVGDRDIRQGRSLNKSPEISEHQGLNRFERGRRWVDAMNSAAQRSKLGARFEFHVLPRCRHSFSRSMDRGEMGRRVFEWLFFSGNKSEQRNGN